MTILNIEFFPFQNTLIIAFIGSLIGQCIILLIAWIKREIDLRRKKEMIINDLKNQLEVLNNVRDKYIELKDKLERRDTDYFTSSVFQTLQLDIYNSVFKNELYSIFKSKMFTLVEIYKSIEFLKMHSPYNVYSDYLEKSESHFEEKKNDPNHEKYCETELGFIENTIKNINNHLNTINSIKDNMKVLNK